MVPRLRILPLVLLVGSAVDHPVIEAFESVAARSQVTKDLRAWRTVMGGTRGAMPVRIQDRLVSLEWRIAVGDHQQRGAVAIQARYLQVARVLANVGVIEAANGVSLVERSEEHTS